MIGTPFSFGVLKPDCVQRGLVERAFSLITDWNLEIILRKNLILSWDDASFLYRRLVEKDFFFNLISYMTSGEVVAFIVQSQDNKAIKKLNSVVGCVDPVLAKQGTLRKMGENICRNIAHSSADEMSAREDILYFFSKKELYNAGLALY